MDYLKKMTVGLLIIVTTLGTSCNGSIREKDKIDSGIEAVIEKHYLALSTKNLGLLESTLSPTGGMTLILPASEVVYGVNAFMDFHKAWFDLPDWTMDYKIIGIERNISLSHVVVESIYFEPDREGKPYCNRMIITYLLEKSETGWHIIADHASSVLKTDYKQEFKH
ncbi:YybH family protein [Flagellimonas sp.]|uniref:YybH family protein n=1 Tax=Flagellimonas sp. TaxID=2058762 RepID=UPI003BACDBF0